MIPQANANFVIVEYETKDDIVNKDGIFIPHKAIENSKLIRGKILSVGEKCKLGVKVGDFVLYDKYAINRYSPTIGALAEDNVILIED